MRGFRSSTTAFGPSRYFSKKSQLLGGTSLSNGPCAGCLLPSSAAISKLLTRNLCLSRSRIAPLNACSTWSQASIFEPARTIAWPTSIVLQRATSGSGRVKRRQAERRGQPSGAVPRPTKAHHATIVGEAEIHRAGGAARDQSVYDRQEKGLRLAGLPGG